MDIEFIYRSNGEYFGFINSGYLFDAEANYVGWVEDDGSVWREDGTYFGELAEEKYILHNPDQIEQPVRMPKTQPMPPTPPMYPPPRMPKIPPMFREDALDKLRNGDE